MRKEVWDRATTPLSRWGRSVRWSLVVLCSLPALAGDPRDLVFECPCRAEWTAGQQGEVGELTLTFGLRSFRSVDSGELVVTVDGQFPDQGGLSLGHISAGAVRLGALASMPHGQRSEGEPIGVWLWEKAAQAPVSIAIAEAGGLSRRGWRHAETLTIWAMAGADGGVVEFVDMLTDTDGDGVGDVNEELTGTSRTDPASTPGVSTIDIVAMYNAGVREALDGYPYTRIHHVMAVTNAAFADSGTNLRMRMVGAVEVELNASGRTRPGEGRGNGGAAWRRPALPLPHGSGAELSCWRGRLRDARRPHIPGGLVERRGLFRGLPGDPHLAVRGARTRTQPGTGPLGPPG